MEVFESRDVVSINFPFSDLSNTKLRPALVLANVGRNDFILCQITSKDYSDFSAISIQPSDFEEGQLPLVSFVRPFKLFTANSSIFHNKYGKINFERHQLIIDSISSKRRE